MNNRWVSLVSLSLVAFASLVMAWQFQHYHAKQDTVYTSIVQSCHSKRNTLAKIPDHYGERVPDNSCLAEQDRYLDLVLPKDARVFMTDMTGPTNYNKIGYYFYIDLLSLPS